MSPPFYNRQRELETVRQALASPRAEMVILYGRRGVGKTALLRQGLSAAQGSTLFYRATRRTLPLQLAALTDVARAAIPQAFVPQPFPSFSAFLEFFSHVAHQRDASDDPHPIALVLDELPYLAQVDPGLLTVLQHWWDDHKHQRSLKVFLAGSYVAFMERHVLDANAPLYNRRTGALHLEPLDYAEAALFFPSYSPREKMEAYALLGGMPSYLEQFDPTADLETNVKATILRQGTYLSEEPDWLLLEDLRRDVIYGSILRAIAAGARKPSDIARAIGKDSAQDVTQQLASLQELGLVVREVPLTERRRPRSRNSLYTLADQYVDFWFRFVDPARSLISQGLGAEIWDRYIAPRLGEYVSRPAFERACRQYLWRARRAGILQTPFVDVGTWWGAGDREIDVVAADERGAILLAGSCKWTDAPVDVADYAALQRDLSRTGAASSDPAFALFSRSGFTKRLREMASSRLRLVTLEEMYRT